MSIYKIVLGIDYSTVEHFDALFPLFYPNFLAE
jgi:hypothetical protein